MDDLHSRRSDGPAHKSGVGCSEKNMIDIFLKLLTPTASRKGETSIVLSGRKGGKQGRKEVLKRKGRKVVLGGNMEISSISRLNRVALNAHGGDR
jgi:hypothetical protein